MIDNLLNKVILGDNVDVLSKFPDKCIDLTVTSPPYSTLRTYNGYSFNFEEVAKELYRVTKQGGVVVWIVGDKTENGGETGDSFRQVLYFQSIGFRIHDTMIYEKTGIRYPDSNRYNQIFEYMFILSKGNPKTFNPIKDKLNKNAGIECKGTRRLPDGTFLNRECFKDKKIEEYGKRTNIWICDSGWLRSTKDKVAFKHPAIFPDKLAQDHIVSWSNSNDIILDPFAGSGTTLKEAYKLNRKFIGIEISKEYCNIIQQRLPITKIIKIKESG